jgi:hypothetical protein
MTLTITQDERDAIGEALDLAHSDQEHYLHYGNPEIDYGTEWEETAQAKAATFRLLGQVGEKLGFHGEAERWEELAKAVLGEEATK